MIRVLVVEDSITVRKRLCEVLAAEADMEVVGEAADGEQAIERCLALRPDVLTMDMMLPQMTGLSATEYIMAHCPTPILVISSSINRGELFSTCDALAAGAVDVLERLGTYTPIFVVSGFAYLTALLVVHLLNPRWAKVTRLAKPSTP